MKLRKLFAMTIAAIMAVSTMAISVSAEETNDKLIASIPNGNSEIIEIYESDLENGEFTTQWGDFSVTIEVGEVNTIPMNLLSTRASLSFVNGRTTPARSKTNAQEVSTSFATGNFSIARGVTACTYDYYKPASNINVIRYTFTPSASGGLGGEVAGTVYCLNSVNDPMIINIYSNPVSATIRDMTSDALTYATVTNNSYSGTATGSCSVSGMNN